MMNKINVHYTENYLINPAHPVTINLIGCGGTGSQVLNSLARMHSALLALGHPGLFVRCWDPDKVTAANMGRQLFSASDIGLHKCVVLIGRINRFFGTDWEASPAFFNLAAKIKHANITISCVDSGLARKEIKSVLVDGAKEQQQRDKNPYGHAHPFERAYYWMDYGNMRDRGQVVLGTLRKIKQPKGSEYNGIDSLPLVDKLHPEILRDKKGEDQGPSCSLAEALDKQDLFINSNLANMGLGLLWKMFRELKLQYHGLYLNLQTLQTNPIKV